MNQSIEFIGQKEADAKTTQSLIFGPNLVNFVFV